jgi:hypothetical protein
MPMLQSRRKPTDVARLNFLDPPALALSQAKWRAQRSLTTDGRRAYLSAVEDAFGGAMIMRRLLKFTGTPQRTPSRAIPRRNAWRTQGDDYGRAGIQTCLTSCVERQI